ncbi:MAG: acylneuraminate cytidylyltransferase family protein, partial [Muribaculaceae bacterium]|nr:acylneuraminate cytidylyltransferase family protein [Muribaculaceae bacterium]
LHVCKGDGLLTRRQDAPPVLEYNGAVYVINPASLRRMSLGEFPRRLPYMMPRSRSIDLDSQADWLMAEHLIAQK